MFSQVSVCSEGVGISGPLSFPGDMSRGISRGWVSPEDGWVLTPSGVGMSRGMGTHHAHAHGTWDVMGYGRQAGGAYPSGMLSCLICRD